MASVEVAVAVAMVSASKLELWQKKHLKKAP
jgi:hypothetical protein